LLGWSFLFAVHEFKELRNLLSISAKEKIQNLNVEYRILQVLRSQAFPDVDIQ
jgi:hypothetical protein